MPGCVITGLQLFDEHVQGQPQKCTTGMGGLPSFKYGKSISVSHFINSAAVCRVAWIHRTMMEMRLLQDFFAVDGNRICLGSVMHSAYLDVKYFPLLCWY